MSHSQPQPEQTVVDILNKLIGHDDGVEFGNGYHDECKAEIAEAVAALNRQALATALRLIGDDVPTPRPEPDFLLGDVYGVEENELRQQLRQAFTDYYGGGE